MPSPNASPITGSELIRALQGGQPVRLTRAQLATLLGSVALPAGQLEWEAMQGGQRITLAMADIPGYLAKTTAVPEPVPADRQPGPLTGVELLVGLQGGERAWSFVYGGFLMTVTNGGRLVGAILVLYDGLVLSDGMVLGSGV